MKPLGMKALGITTLGLVGGFALVAFATVDQEMIALKTAAEHAVRGELTDPGSAQFDGTIVVKSERLVCGFVNARNRMGGYDGRKMYVYSSPLAYIIKDGDTVKALKTQISKCGLCTSLVWGCDGPGGRR